MYDGAGKGCRLSGPCREEGFMCAFVTAEPGVVLDEASRPCAPTRRCFGPLPGAGCRDATAQARRTVVGHIAGRQP